MAKEKRPSRQEILEKLATNELPSPLQGKLSDVRDAIDALREEAESWGVKREFSPDGRFLGDVGELIAKLFFGVKLNVRQAKGHDARSAEIDAVTEDRKGHSVEVKLRSRSTNIHFSTIADIIFVIYVSPLTLKWGVVCNGPGGMLLNAAKKLEGGKYGTDCYKLLAAQECIGSPSPKLTQIEPTVPHSAI